jgi:predicted transcriptional regulator of viral defense system
MEFATRSLSPQESRVVLALTERGQRETTRREIVELLGGSPKVADHVIESLRRKGWLERATWGEYLVLPPEQGPHALGNNNLLALASRIADPYYIGFGTAAAHYGLTTQHRKVIFVVTPVRLRAREVGESRVRIVNLSAKKFFGFESVDVLGYKVMISDREKTAIDCIDHAALAGGVGEAATILATAAAGLTGPRRPITWRRSVQALWRGALAGSVITSKPMFCPRCGTACSRWRRKAARHGSDPIPRAHARCRALSAMTRRGVSSST